MNVSRSNFNKQWLNERKISDLILEKFKVDYTNDITIPIHGANGVFSFAKHRRSPELSYAFGPKYWYDKGAKSCLYGACFIRKEKVVVICEGELDALVLWSHNIPAVSSTGGAMTFKEEWAELLKDKEVYICYDNDSAGVRGAVHVLKIIKHAKVILLPTVTGLKDVTDYYRMIGDIRGLMQTAKHYNTLEAVELDQNQRRSKAESDEFHKELIRVWEEENKVPDSVRPRSESDNDLMDAKSVPIESIIKVNYQNKSVCPFHHEKTPSLQVYPDNRFYCFGCNKSGSVIDIVMELYQLNFHDSIKFLLKK